MSCFDHLLIFLVQKTIYLGHHFFRTFKSRCRLDSYWASEHKETKLSQVNMFKDDLFIKLILHEQFPSKSSSCAYNCRPTQIKFFDTTNISAPRKSLSTKNDKIIFSSPFLWPKELSFLCQHPWMICLTSRFEKNHPKNHNDFMGISGCSLNASWPQEIKAF